MFAAKARHLASFLFFCLLLLSKEAIAKSIDNGRVNMRGGITETACAIDIISLDQTIKMPVISASQIMNSGKGKNHPLTINLINCVLGRSDPKLPDWQRFEVIFDGSAEHGLFELDGQMKGIALQISDTKGNVMIPGTPLPSRTIMNGNRQLKYFVRLVANKKEPRLGSYASTLRFKMNYY